MSFRFISLFLLVHGVTVVFSKNVPCNLNFLSTTSDKVAPENAVSVSDLGGSYAARFEKDGSWIGGRITNHSQAVGVNGGITEESNFYEILTNPNNCQIQWTSTKDKYSVKFNDNSYVGRVYSGNSFLAGSLDSTGNLHFVDENLEPQTTQSAVQYLSSFTSGLKVSISQFKMATNNGMNNVEFVGMDFVHNQSPATVKQTVTHQKIVTQKIAMTTSGSPFSSDIFSNLDMKIQLSFTGAGGPFVDASQELVAGSSTDFEKTEQKEITTEREVEIPKYTSVHICSTLTTAEDFSAEYSAEAEATGTGLSPSEIFEFMKSEGQDAGWRLENNRVVRSITGIVSGIVPLSSQFTVTPADSSTGCLQVASLIKENSKLAKFASRGNETAKTVLHANIDTLKNLLDIF